MGKHSLDLRRLRFCCPLIVDELILARASHFYSLTFLTMSMAYTQPTYAQHRPNPSTSTGLTPSYILLHTGLQQLQLEPVEVRLHRLAQ